MTHSGTTSACAENTSLRSGHRQKQGNYLRVRGEYQRLNDTNIDLRELPPRARRIPSGNLTPATLTGTTSACAENTPLWRPPVHARRNYLRVRGEYRRSISGIVTIMELPPRARRIRTDCFLKQSHTGTTSACAENTFGAVFLINIIGNYLRVRGEYFRVRNRDTHSPGTTSACAENTTVR